MPNCVVKGCSNHSSKNKKQDGITFHTFPIRNDSVKEKWIEVIRVSRNEPSWNPTVRSVVCSTHFEKDDLYYTKKGLRRVLRYGYPKHLPAPPDQSANIDLNEPTTMYTYNFGANIEIELPGLSDEYQGVVSETAASNLSAFSQLPKEDSSRIENEIKVFCPKCDMEVSHTAEGIQQDQTKILVAKVYHYLEQEYEELKTIYGDLDLTPLSKFRQRTALATGVSETTVLQILKEEEERNADKRQEPTETRRRARKRSRKTDSSSEENSSDDNVADNEQSSDVHETQMVVVKIEPTEYYNEEPEVYVPATVKVEPSDVQLNKEQTQHDPISVEVKTEPRTDVLDNTNETLALNEPAGTKRRARQIPRSDVTSTRSGVGDTEIKAEEIEIHEEGVS